MPDTLEHPLSTSPGLGLEFSRGFSIGTQSFGVSVWGCISVFTDRSSLGVREGCIGLGRFYLKSLSRSSNITGMPLSYALSCHIPHIS